MTNTRSTRTTRPDATQWPGSGALAAIYARAIEHFQEETEDGPTTAPDDAMMKQIEGVDHVERRPD
jgi:hypothetical protein